MPAFLRQSTCAGSSRFRSMLIKLIGTDDNVVSWTNSNLVYGHNSHGISPMVTSMNKCPIETQCGQVIYLSFMLNIV